MPLCVLFQKEKQTVLPLTLLRKFSVSIWNQEHFQVNVLFISRLFEGGGGNRVADFYVEKLNCIINYFRRITSKGTYKFKNRIVAQRS